MRGTDDDDDVAASQLAKALFFLSARLGRGTPAGGRGDDRSARLSGLGLGRTVVHHVSKGKPWLQPDLNLDSKMLASIYKALSGAMTVFWLQRYIPSLLSPASSAPIVHGGQWVSDRTLWPHPAATSA